MPREQEHDSNADRQRAYRERKTVEEKLQEWHERGYALQPGPPEEEPRTAEPFASYVGAWCDGLWQRHAELQAEDQAGKYAELERKRVKS